VRRASLVIILFIVLRVTAQERLGMANSNYFSTTSIFLNPSSSVDSRTFMQLNLVGANVYAKTNVAYLPKFSVWGGLGGIQDPVVSETESNKYLYAYLGADGPIFVISKNRFGAGFFARGRSVINMRRIPYELTSMLAGQEPEYTGPSTFDNRNAGYSNMSWLEYGVNFGMMVKHSRSDFMSVGGNLKYLNGFNVFYANLTELRGSYNDSLLRLDTLRGTIRYNAAALGSGKGYGMDLGFTYKKMLGTIDNYYVHSQRSSCKYVDYKYKIGLSLRDIGYIRYSGNTSVADINSSGTFYSGSTDMSYVPVLNAITNTTFAAEPITAFLPASFSAQFDYNFENSIYLNGTVVKNLVPGNFTGVQAADLISVAPRFELRYFEAAFPLTFHRFIYPQVGFGLRFRSLVIGMDNMLPLFIKTNTYGLNLYFNLAVSIFKNPACGSRTISVSDCPPSYLWGKNKKAKAKRFLRFRKTYAR
jgi:hypothetical protein